MIIVHVGCIVEYGTCGKPSGLQLHSDLLNEQGNRDRVVVFLLEPMLGVDVRGHGLHKHAIVEVLGCGKRSLDVGNRELSLLRPLLCRLLLLF